MKINNLDQIVLVDTGLLSIDNEPLIRFLCDNEIVMVSEFLKMMKCEKFKKGTYVDVINEARGLYDILGLKYFDKPFVSDCYLYSPIRMEKFVIYGDGHVLPAVTDYNKKKINIYSAITRLGFNSNERVVILDRDYDSVDGKRLIDLLEDTYMKLSVKDSPSSDEIILCNKLLLILSYYRKKCSMNENKQRDQYVYSRLKELNSLIERRDILDKKIIAIEDELKKLGVSR